MPPQNDKTRIVILGAGFAGVYSFRYLHRHFHKDPTVELVLVNRTNYFLFTPLLHEVATGSVNPSHIVEPIRRVLGCCLADFWQAEVRRVRLEEHIVETTLGELPYDYLIIALGSQTHFYDTPGAREHALTLKSLDDALNVKRRVIATFEEASKEKDAASRRAKLSFAVVGGGATGVELAAELAELIYETLPTHFPRLDFGEVSITLLERGDELLKRFSKKLRSKAFQTLRRKKVRVTLEAAVSSVEPAGVYWRSAGMKPGDTPPEFLAARTVIWTSGIRPALLETIPAVERDWQGRFVVNTLLQLPRHPNVFALGDIAAFTDPSGPDPLPPFAQVATKEAKGAARAIVALRKGQRPAPFRYRHRGDLVSLGQWMAVGEIARVRFWGHFAWWLWRTIYLSKLISWRKKFKVALDWTINLFSPRDISEI